MKLFKIVLSGVFLATCLFSIAASAQKSYQSWEQVCADTQQVVESGDLIFLDIPSRIFRNVAATSKSWTSHVGVVFKNPQGVITVMESTIPQSKETELCQFLQKSSDFLFEVRRVGNNLRPEQLLKMKTSADSLMGIPYDYGFDFNNDKKLFCSKFAYLVYKTAGVEMGRFQTFKNLLDENPDAPVDFWRFWFVGSIPWERVTITPASELNDPQFKTLIKGTLISH